MEEEALKSRNDSPVLKISPVCKTIAQICPREWEMLGQVHPSCGWDGFSRTWQAEFASVHPLGELEQGGPGFVPLSTPPSVQWL